MDINQTKFSNHSTWNPEMSIEDHQILDHDQLPFGSVWPSCYSLQTVLQSTPINPSSSQIPVLSSLLSDQIGNNTEEADHDQEEDPEEELGGMKEMMYRIAAMQPVDIDPATIRKPKRRNVRISDDPQSIAARLRRERISEKIRILQRLVPGGRKMDTASMLDEAIRYVKFLKRQVRLLQPNHHHHQHQHQQPCNYTNGDHWPQIAAAYINNKAPLASTAVVTAISSTPSSLDQAPRSATTSPAGLFILGGNGNGVGDPSSSSSPLCFDHDQVISD